MNQELIFVYNAESGWFNSLSDLAHKIISPETYPCRLCALTYGNFQMEKEWKTFLKNLNLPCRFWYKNDLKIHPEITFELPAILVKNDSGTHLIMSRSELENCPGLSALIAKLREKLAEAISGN